MPIVRWLLTLFSDVDHLKVFKVLWFSKGALPEQHAVLIPRWCAGCVHYGLT